MTPQIPHMRRFHRSMQIERSDLPRESPEKVTNCSIAERSLDAAAEARASSLERAS